tara:strand:- start:435 stop:545 length:111 start_codon:yes stop_codon:yes gene_type:complete
VDLRKADIELLFWLKVEEKAIYSTKRFLKSVGAERP